MARPHNSRHGSVRGAAQQRLVPEGLASLMYRLLLHTPAKLRAIFETATVTSSAQPSPRTSVSAPLYLGFAATGIGVALPGATLPAMLARWSLSDAQGGRLFLYAWIGSSLGALGVQGYLRRTLVVGCGAIAAGVLGLAFGPGGSVAADGFMLVYGAGLGLTMTSISLIQQAAAGERSAVELIRLNLVWAVGAFLCPALAGHTLATGNLRPLLGTLASFFTLLALWAVANRSLGSFEAEGNGIAGWRALLRVPPALVLMIMLVTGIEASAGGWLTTYAWREGQGLATVIAAPTCLWAGLLASRFFWSVRGKSLRCAQVVRISALLTAIAGSLIILRHEPAVVGGAAFLLGLGLGPLYPLLLDCVLRSTRGGPIFFLAGVGSACLPWLTGVVASENGSLRTGLLVPVGGTMLVTIIALILPLRTWNPASR